MVHAAVRSNGGLDLGFARVAGWECAAFPAELQVKYGRGIVTTFMTSWHGLHDANHTWQGDFLETLVAVLARGSWTALRTFVG